MAGSFKAYLDRLTKADIAFYLLPFIMLMITAGTIAQRDMGLFAAQKMFFTSFILWMGPVPLPGLYTLTGALALSLLLKFLLASDWSFRKCGINLAHLGVLILLAGGFLTALTAREGYMLIGEGDTTPYVYDYTKRELFIFENDLLQQTIAFDKLTPGKTFSIPFELTVQDRCVNCVIAKRENKDKKYHGMAQFMNLQPKQPEKEPEQNISGLTFNIASPDKHIHIAFEGMPKPVEIQTGGRSYKIMFGRQQRLLPFAIKLQDFKKENYPGLDKARDYSSDITVLDNGVEWPSRIEMNKPLRYKGYSFYQSSFEEGPGGELTVLSVVENKGRLFPYIGTLLISAGLLLHLLIMMSLRGMK